MAKMIAHGITLALKFDNFEDGTSVDNLATTMEKRDLPFSATTSKVKKAWRIIYNMKGSFL